MAPRCHKTSSDTSRQELPASQAKSCWHLRVTRPHLTSRQSTGPANKWEAGERRCCEAGARTSCVPRHVGQLQLNSPSVTNNSNPPHRSCEASAASHVTWSHELAVTSHLPPLSSVLTPTKTERERERGLGVYLVSGDEGSKESSSHHHKLHPLLTNTSGVTKRRPGATKHHATATQTKTRSRQAEAGI